MIDANGVPLSIHAKVRKLYLLQLSYNNESQMVFLPDEFWDAVREALLETREEAKAPIDG